MTTDPNSEYTDILYDVEDTTAIVTIYRPDRYNAFRAGTVEELIAAFRRAWADRKIRCIILTGVGEKPSAPAVRSSSGWRPGTTGRPRAACSRSTTSTS